MEPDAAVVQRLKALLAENKEGEARSLLVAELGLTQAGARSYVDRLAKAVETTESPTGKKPSSKITGLVFLGLGLVFMAVGTYMFVQKNTTLDNSYLTKGVVVGFTAMGSDQVWQGPQFDDETSYTPVIAYAFDGETYQVAGGVSSSPPAYQVDEEVEIYVDKDNPLNITINSFFNKWLLILVFGLFTFVFGVIGALLLIFKPATTTSTTDLFILDEERLVSVDDFD